MPSSLSDWLLSLSVPAVLVVSALYGVGECWWQRRRRRAAARLAHPSSRGVRRAVALVAEVEAEGASVRAAESVVSEADARVGHLYLVPEEPGGRP